MRGSVSRRRRNRCLRVRNLGREGRKDKEQRGRPSLEVAIQCQMLLSCLTFLSSHTLSSGLD